MNKCHKCGERFGTLYLELQDDMMKLVCRRCKYVLDGQDTDGSGGTELDVLVCDHNPSEGYGDDDQKHKGRSGDIDVRQLLQGN